MSNDYYSVTGNPAAVSRGTSARIREEFDSIEAAFDLLPTPAELAGGAPNLGTDSGTANAYVITASAQIDTLFNGLTIRFQAATSNTGAATVNVNSLGAKAIVRPTGAALAAGDILAGQFTEIAYSTTDGNWQLALSATGATPASFSGTAAGTVDLLAGASVASAATINLNAATGNLVHVTGTTTITAVTLTRGPRWVVFDGALTLTHHATNNNLPGAANILTAAGDRALYFADGTTVYCLHYVRAPALGTPVLHVRDEKASGAASGNSTTGSFITRTLNTVVTNEITGASLASNQVTLPAGTYEFEGIGPVTAGTNQATMAMLYNVTDAAVTLYGLTVHADNSGTGGPVDLLAPVRGKFTISASKTLELRQRFAVVGPMGTQSSFGVNEVYSSLYFRKVA
jgi:hypothetical protein